MGYDGVESAAGFEKRAGARLTALAATTPADEELTFGKHRGRRFEELWQQERGYCGWVTGIIQPTGQLERLAEYVRACERGVPATVPAPRPGGPGLPRPAPAAPPGPAAAGRHVLRTQEGYLAMIRSGRKTVEGRLNVGAMRRVSAGDSLALQSPRSFLDVRVASVRAFASFRALLESCGLEAVLPGCGSLEQGVLVYHGFPSYAQLAARYGVLAFSLEPLVQAQGGAGGSDAKRPRVA